MRCGHLLRRYLPEKGVGHAQASQVDPGDTAILQPYGGDLRLHIPYRCRWRGLCANEKERFEWRG